MLIPVRKAEPWLAESIASILRRTHDCLEVLVIDNASTDAPAAVAGRFGGDTRLSLLSEPCGHLASALNTALRQARGAFVARQDADDVSEPDRLARQLAALLADPEVGVVGCAYSQLPLSGGSLPEPPIFTDPAAIHKRLLTAMPFAGGSILARRALFDALEGFDPHFDGALGEDYDFLVRAAEVTIVAGVPERLYTHRKGNPASLSGRSGYDYRVAKALVRDRAAQRGSTFFAGRVA